MINFNMFILYFVKLVDDSFQNVNVIRRVWIGRIIKLYMHAFSNTNIEVNINYA